MDLDAKSFRSKKSNRSSKLTSSEKAARTVLAPFLKRLKRPDSKGVLQNVDEERHKTYIQSRLKNVITKLTSTDTFELPLALTETSEILREVTKAMGVSSYLADDSDHIVVNAKYLPPNSRNTARYKIGDPRFPLGVAGAGKLVKSVLCTPVLTTAEGKCLAVIELYKDVNQVPFSVLDLQICVSMTGWMGAAVHQNNERLFLLRKSELNNYLTSLVEFFFAEALSLDKFVSDIIECAKVSTGAERAYFYLMDEEVPANTEEDIVADMYEESLDSVPFSYKKKNKQRFSKNSKMLAGYVARHGKLINVPDAFEDRKFSMPTDISGNITRSVIGVPLKGNQGVLGVLVAVNKVREDCFNSEDETLLVNIASHAYLACQHGCIKKLLRKSVTMGWHVGDQDLLKIYMKPCASELETALAQPVLKRANIPEKFFDFDWVIIGKENRAIEYSIFMFTHLLGDKFFDFQTLVGFILTVKKSYRNNAYHNFVHAFTVCHCMFNIINKNKESFTELEILGSLIAAICHDSDHLGFTNNFLQMTHHWLAELYWESPLEHHHHDVCILIIEGTNILNSLTSSQMTVILKFIRNLILATDLVQFFRHRNPIMSLLKTKTFDWNFEEHRMMFMGVLMTVCDVSGQCKPFYTAKKVTESLYREFYHQGDVEKSLGYTPMSMMDRTKTFSVPENQYQFLTLVCIPSVEILVTVFPNTKKLLLQCEELKEFWNVILSKQVVKMWKIEDAMVQTSQK